jgi:hypothetical protein
MGDLITHRLVGRTQQGWLTKGDRLYDFDPPAAGGDILGVAVPCLTVPVRPGRNLASIVEVAAMNYRLHTLGYNSARNFVVKQQEVTSKGAENTIYPLNDVYGKY